MMVTRPRRTESKYELYGRMVHNWPRTDAAAAATAATKQCDELTGSVCNADLAAERGTNLHQRGRAQMSWLVVVDYSFI